MNPGIFSAIANDPTLASLLGNKPVRFFPYGSAPDKVSRPYCTYGVISGLPENTLDQVPVIDRMGTQIDVWASTVESCEAVATRIRDVLEPLGHMTAFTSASRELETQLFTSRLEFDFWVDR